MLRSTARFATIIFAGALVFAGGDIKANAESVYNSTAVAGVTVSVDSYLTNVSNQTTIQATTTETTANVDAATTVDPAATTADPAATTEVASENADLVLAKVDDCVNIRKKNDTESDVVGKMYKGDAGTIVKQKDGWTKLKSGNAKGWVKDEFLVFGDEAAQYGSEICDKIATVTTTTLKVRDKKSVESDCVTLIPEGENYEVVKEYKNWIRISIDGDMQGYVSKDFVKVECDYGQALTTDEIQAAADAEATAALAAQQPATTQAQAPVSTSKPVEKKKSTKVVTTPSGSTLNETSTSNSSSGSAAANYALQFVGNPYVYGGSSLTKGADCSGFTMSVYAHFGYSLPHSAAAQSGCGKSVSMSNLQPGDLLFYSNGGGINHVAMYIGGGMVVHASTAKTGIKTSVYNYRSPVKAVRIMN